MSVWYPGHMARALREMRASLELIDVVIEAIDARVPQSGASPALTRLATRKRHVVALTRNDLADPKVTRRWLESFAARGIGVVAVDARQARSAGTIVAMIERHRRAGVTRAMVVGIPNSGKSTIVNALLKRKAAKAADRAGVTRRAQWFRLSAGVELMDTPGVLPPKIRDSGAMWKLAATGALPSERYDPEEAAREVAGWARQHGVATIPEVESFAATRGFMRRGGRVDEHAAAQSYLRAFNDGKFGRISLETPDEREAA
jgi:ribosome biogenesis GTPase A